MKTISFSFLSLVAILAFSSVVTSPVSANGLVSHWAFENNLLDSSPNGNDGTPVGGDGTVEYIAGAFGSAIDINSEEGVINSAAAGLPALGGDAWTMNLWAKIAATPTQLQHLGGFGGSLAPDNNLGDKRAFIVFGGRRNENYYFWGSNRDLDSGAGYETDNEWHMYTISYDGSDVHMYKDAALVQSASIDLIDLNELEIQVGNPSNWNSEFRGGLDEFTIWDRQLSQTAINGLFTSNVAIPEPSTMGLMLLATMGHFSRRRRA